MVTKNFVQKIADKEIDDVVHRKFTRFSLGEFPREAVLIKKTANAVQVQTGFEYATDLFLLVADLLPDNVILSGDGTVISSSNSLDKELDAVGLKIKASRGKKYTVTFELSVKDFKAMVDKFGEYISLFKFKVGDLELKMKPSPPKPGSLAEKFATLKVDNKYADAVLKNFLFDVKVDKFKSAEIKSTFIIEDVKIPKGYENDFAMARKMAQKKGKIHRIVSVDGKEVKNYELEFLA
ncbi:MAG: hypothetical protein ABIG93_04255 [archaeon]|nr:hypothetical protein [Nanoarchaeota archaeon]